MMYPTRRARIEAEKIQRRGRKMRSMKVGFAGFATIAGVSVATISPAHADHTVQRGDTLSQIAAKYDGVTVAGLMKSNGLTSHLIYPGQRLAFTSKSSSASSSTPKATSTSKAKSKPKRTSQRYTVVSGDTLGAIASRYDVSLSSLMKANNLSSYLIYPGNKLTIPGSSSSSSNTSTSSSSSSRSTPTRSATPTSNSRAKTHTVVSGDTLSRIAARHGVSLSALMSANNLSSHLIYPGNKLTIPGSSSSSSSSASSSSSTSSSSSSRPAAPAAPAPSRTSGTHTIVSGDTLGRIASRYGVSVSALMSANRLSSHWIYAGDKLTIPGSNSSSSTANTTIDSSNSNRVSASSANTPSSSTTGSAWAVKMANGGGATYRYGGNGEGNQYDCSGYTKAALAKDGKHIPRNSAAQYASAQKISASQLRAGDLVFYGSSRVTHVAIYVGNGQIAHARNPSAGVTTNSLASYSKYNNVIGYGRY